MHSQPNPSSQRTASPFADTFERDRLAARELAREQRSSGLFGRNGFGMGMGMGMGTSAGFAQGMGMGGFAGGASATPSQIASQLQPDAFRRAMYANAYSAASSPLPPSAIHPPSHSKRNLRSASPEKQTRKKLPLYDQFKEIEQSAAWSATKPSRKRTLPTTTTSSQPATCARRGNTPKNSKRPTVYEEFREIERSAAKGASKPSRKRPSPPSTSTQPAKRPRLSSIPKVHEQNSPAKMNNNQPSKQLKALQEQFNVQARASAEDARRMMPPPPAPAPSSARSPSAHPMVPSSNIATFSSPYGNPFGSNPNANASGYSKPAHTPSPFASTRDPKASTPLQHPATTQKQPASFANTRDPKPKPSHHPATKQKLSTSKPAASLLHTTQNARITKQDYHLQHHKRPYSVQEATARARVLGNEAQKQAHGEYEAELWKRREGVRNGGHVLGAESGGAAWEIARLGVDQRDVPVPSVETAYASVDLTAEGWEGPAAAEESGFSPLFAAPSSESNGIALNFASPGAFQEPYVDDEGFLRAPELVGVSQESADLEEMLQEVERRERKPCRRRDWASGWY